LLDLQEKKRDLGGWENEESLEGKRKKKKEKQNAARETQERGLK
jgi:hypothetical protein